MPYSASQSCLVANSNDDDEHDDRDQDLSYTNSNCNKSSSCSGIVYTHIYVDPCISRPPTFWLKICLK